MKRSILGILFTTYLVLGQSADTQPKFAAADIHPMVGRPTAMRTSPVRVDRYEIKSASLADLISTAYKTDLDKIFGGPIWMEHSRFDITAKVPTGTTPENLPPMLQSLLADRFGLAFHKESRPMPAYVLVAGKKPLLKEATAGDESGCRPSGSPGVVPGRGVFRIGIPDSQGQAQMVTLGGDLTITYSCRNMTMASFVSNLPKMMGNGLGGKPVSDETGLQGSWDFDVRWSSGLRMMATSGDEPETISAADAIAKQLGLNLEERQVPTPVIVVDKTFEKPSPNPANTAELLPGIVLPTKFEVASVKPSAPNGRGFGQQIQPGGRVNVSQPMRSLLMWALKVDNTEGIAGVPEWANSERFDIIAQAQTDSATAPFIDRDAVAPMLRNLLEERFGLKYHTEDRQLTAYTLVAAKPKMKKTDPASHTFCHNKQAPPPAPAGTLVLTCQNMTMVQLAEWLSLAAPELTWPVLDGTGLEGGWDFTLSFNPGAGLPVAARAGGGDGAQANASADPSGRLTVFDAVEKQLGLKLDKQKRDEPVVVIDHLEQKPTDN